MSETIKLRKGLDIRLKGRAAETVTRLKPSAEYSLVPDDFVGVTPKVAVKEGTMSVRATHCLSTSVSLRWALRPQSAEL